jgi:hypothetical protein
LLLFSYKLPLALKIFCQKSCYSVRARSFSLV